MSRRSIALVAATLTMLVGDPAFGQDRLLQVVATSADADLYEVRRADALMDSLVRTDALVLSSQQPDRHVQGRFHESWKQLHQGIPVQGGGVSRQLADGVTVSIFGTIHQEIDVDTVPRLTPKEALDVVERRANTGVPATDDGPTLVILSTLLDTYALVYRATMLDRKTYFVNAHTGAIVHEESEVREQSAAVGVGHGIRGQRKKVSASSDDGSYRAHDRLRPAEIVTLDLRYNDRRFDSLIDSRGPRWTASDVARDGDNRWNDDAVVDAHVYTGFTYDYLLGHGWRGMNGRNGRILPMVNLAFENAFFFPPPFGPEKTGAIAFGQLDDGTPFTAADIVAHEIMHGVTYFSVRRRTGERGGLLDTHRDITGPSSFTVTYDDFRWSGRCGVPYYYRGDCYTCGRRFYFVCRDGRLLLYANHGGAVNEAYSDIIGTAVEFSVHGPESSVHEDGPGPLRADYLIGEDNGMASRSLEDPRSFPLSPRMDHRYPDAYSGLVRFLVEFYPDKEETFYSGVGSLDGGRHIVALPSYNYSGVHWNSTVLSHAFYLAVEGGRNATTGLRVRGVGRGNRWRVEQVFFRAMVDMMPAATTLPMASRVVRQSAIDLFGARSPTYRAVLDALSAVGLG